MSHEVHAAGKVAALREQLEQATTRAEAAEAEAAHLRACMERAALLTNVDGGPEKVAEHLQTLGRSYQQQIEVLGAVKADNRALIHAAASVLAELDLIRKYWRSARAPQRLVTQETHELLRSVLANKEAAAIAADPRA